jgi:cobalt-zinc-cadmium efflux system outer membrane protein
LKENLTLLASYYDVSAAEAELIQSKLWNNPNLVWNQDLYSVEQNKYFNYKNQRLLQFEQIFSVAGKHTNTVRLSKVGVSLASCSFKMYCEVYFLNLAMFTIHYTLRKQKQELYLQTLSRYEQLINSAQEKQRVGSMAANEVLRLKSEQIAIRAEATQNNNEVLELMSGLRIMLNLTDSVNLQTIETPFELGTLQALYMLIDIALESRPDFKLQQLQVKYEEQNLRLQHSLVMPDVTVGYQPHDKGSNYVRPYQGLTLELNLPVFNRNQGNIKLAQTENFTNATKIGTG